jgi:hypothetical protein
LGFDSSDVDIDSSVGAALSYVEIEIQSISTLPTTKYKPSKKKKKKNYQVQTLNGLHGLTLFHYPYYLSYHALPIKVKIIS